MIKYRTQHASNKEPVTTTAASRSNAAQTIAPSIYRALLYIEWASLLALALRLLMEVLSKSSSFRADAGNYLALALVFVLAALSNVFPVNRPLWQRRGYIFIEIVCLLAGRTFAGWDLDPIMYLVLVKSCFLLSRSDVIFTTIAGGVAWQLGVAKNMSHSYFGPVEVLRKDYGYFLAAPNKSLLFLAELVNSSTIYITLSFLVVLLSMAILTERKSRQQAVELAQTVEALAADLERTRIARNIHDSLGHTLTTLDVQLEVAQTLRTQNPDESLRALNIAKELSSESLQDVRRAVSTMRHSDFDLEEAIANLIAQIKQTHHLEVTTQIDVPILPLQVNQQLYLIVKEGLVNVGKHAQASELNLWIQTTAKKVTLELSDNGVGFSHKTSNTGFGLRGMQERVHLLRGQMTIQSTAAVGTTIRVVIPR